MKNNAKATPIVLVCVTDQIKCDRLIRSGRQMADCFSLDLEVLSVETGVARGERAGLGIEHLYSVSSQHNAEMTVYYHHDPLTSIKRYIERTNIAHIVVGVPPAPGDSRFIDGLLEAFPKIPLTIVTEAGDFYLAQSTPYDMIKCAIA